MRKLPEIAQSHLYKREMHTAAVSCVETQFLKKFLFKVCIWTVFAVCLSLFLRFHGCVEPWMFFASTLGCFLQADGGSVRTKRG